MTRAVRTRLESDRTKKTERLRKLAWLDMARGTLLLCAIHGMQRVTGHNRAENLRLACGCTRPARVTDLEAHEMDEEEDAA